MRPSVCIFNSDLSCVLTARPSMAAVRTPLYCVSSSSLYSYT